METQKQVARKLIETILFNHASQLLKKTGNPTGVVLYFENYATLNKFDRDLVSKAIQYFLQLSFRFETSKTAIVQMCVALHISSSAIYKFCSISRTRLCELKKDKDKLNSFLENSPPAQFSFATDKLLAEFFEKMIETNVYVDEDVLEVAHTINKILERDDDEYVEIY